MLRQALYGSLSVLNRFIPKDERSVVLCSYPDYADNSLALFEHLLRHRQGQYDYCWLLDSMDSVADYSSQAAQLDPQARVEFLPRRSARALARYMRSRHVFMTHGLYSDLRLAPHQRVVNLWHGMPLKKIGLLEGAKRVPRSHTTVASSPPFQDILAQAFGQGADRVIVSGQPRLDWLFQDADHLARVGVDRSRYRAILFWAPTFRSEISERPSAALLAGLPTVPLDQLHRLDEMLAARQAFCLVKVHPLDGLNTIDFGDYEHLMVLKEDVMRESGARFHNLLGEVDGLLTDFSSVYVDFLLTGRPMAFPVDDFQEYERERGFLFDDVRERLPGAMLDSIDALAGFVDVITGEKPDAYADQRALRNAELNHVTSDFTAHLVAHLDL